MKMKKTVRLILFALVILSMLALVACAEEDAPTSPGPGSEAPPGNIQDPAGGDDVVNDRPFEGQTLTVITGAAAHLEAIAGYFTEETGITLEIMGMTSGDIRTRFALEAASRTGTLDILGANYQWHAEFITDEASLYLPIERFMNNPDFPQIPWDEFSRDAIEAYSMFRGVYYGVPHTVDVYLFTFNRAMYEQAGLDPDRPPTTWAEVIENARIIEEAIPGVRGFAANGFRDLQIGTTYTQILFSLGANWTNDDHTIALFDQPAAREALEILVELFEVSPPESVAFNGVDTAQAFAAGRVAQILNWPGVFGLNFTDEFLLIDPDDIVYAETPQGNSILGGWSYFINYHTPNADASYHFLAWFARSDIQIKYALSGGATANLVALANTDVIERFPYMPAVAASMYSAWPYQIMPVTGELRMLMSEELNDFITGVTDFEGALRGMQNRTQQLLDDMNR